MFYFDDFYRDHITRLRQQLGAERALDVFAERCGLFAATAPRGDLTLTIGAEDYFDYTYAYLHASINQDEYERDLATVPTLPALPLEALRDLAFKGQVLQSLHLLSARGVRLSTFPVPGDNRVTKVEFWPNERARQGRIVMNDRQFFGEVPSAVWQLSGGGGAAVRAVYGGPGGGEARALRHRPRAPDGRRDLRNTRRARRDRRGTRRWSAGRAGAGRVLTRGCAKPKPLPTTPRATDRYGRRPYKNSDSFHL
ncbi:MAG: type ISP restriction/modification enzyme [Trueperaceae bacterium]|nr:type ISP restriction/modification enzyme [Trueperaceae bacterium]